MSTWHTKSLKSPLVADARATAREEKKTIEWQEWSNLSYHFELCENECVCEKNDDCLAKKLNKCNYCGDIKKSKCSKRACKAQQLPIANGEPMLAIEL